MVYLLKKSYFEVLLTIFKIKCEIFCIFELMFNLLLPLNNCFLCRNLLIKSVRLNAVKSKGALTNFLFSSQLLKIFCKIYYQILVSCSHLLLLFFPFLKYIRLCEKYSFPVYLFHLLQSCRDIICLLSRNFDQYNNLDFFQKK